MPETDYNHIISEIKSLNLSDQLQLLEKMATLIRKNANKNKKHSILELEGKGKHIWEDLNVKEYINRERESWNG